MSRTALIAGGTGLVGGHLVRLLAATAAYGRVIAITRRPIADKPALVDELVADFDHLESAPLPAVDDVYCALGTTIRKAGSQAAFRRVDLEYPLALARAARRAGATRYALVSSVGANPNTGNFYLRTKGELERELATIGFESLLIARPSFLVGNRAENRPGERIALALAPVFAPLMIGGARRYRPIEAERVAAALVALTLSAAPGVTVAEYDQLIAAERS